jgi:hypothetical protein
VLALFASDVSGSYNGFGIRRWFEWPRAQPGARWHAVEVPLEALDARAPALDDAGAGAEAIRAPSAALKVGGAGKFASIDVPRATADHAHAARLTASLRPLVKRYRTY